MPNDTSAYNKSLQGLAGVLAVLLPLGEVGNVILLRQPWYAVVAHLLAAACLGWGMGAYALGVRGPFNWGKRDKAG